MRLRSSCCSRRTRGTSSHSMRCWAGPSRRLRESGRECEIGQKSKVKGQRAKGKGQRAKGKGQRAKGKGQRDKEISFALLTFDFCLLTWRSLKHKHCAGVSDGVVVLIAADS